MHFKIFITRVPMILAATVALAACQKSDDSPAPGLDPKAVLGSWEVDSIIKDGNKDNSKDGNKDNSVQVGTINSDGYTPKSNVQQYKITDTHLTSIHSDGVVASVGIDDDYKIAGIRLVTQNPASKDGFGITVLSVDNATMTMQLNGASTDVKTVYHLKRIDEAQLATFALPPVMQWVKYTITPSEPKADILSLNLQNLPASSVDTMGNSLVCSYSKSATPSLSISLSVLKKGADGKTEASANDQSLLIGAQVPLDFSKSTETLDSKVGSDDNVSSLKGVTIAKDKTGKAVSMLFSISSGTDMGNACTVHIVRNDQSAKGQSAKAAGDRDLQFTVSCPNVTVGGATGTTGNKLELTGECVVMFADSKLPSDTDTKKADAKAPANDKGPDATTPQG